MSEIVRRKYLEFYKEHGYVPRILELYNNKEVIDVCPTITTRVAMLGVAFH